eukprot:COSAG06_NODE_5962_length_3182_cov_11.158936_3_plen_33_part_00
MLWRRQKVSRSRMIRSDGISISISSITTTTCK